MRIQIKRPDVPVARLLAFVLPLVAGLMVLYAMLRVLPHAGDPAALLRGARLLAERTPVVEVGWIEEAFPPRYLTSPPGALPCASRTNAPRRTRAAVETALVEARRGETQVAMDRLQRLGDRHWLPPLVLGLLLLDSQTEAAQAEFAQTENVSRSQLVLVRAVERQGIRPSDNEQTLRAQIYLMQATAFLQIEHDRADDNLFTYVKNPIGFTKLLVQRGRLADVQSMPTWSQLEIAPPGCPPGTRGALSTYDLYNNLLVAYLKSPDYEETQSERDDEFKRTYRDSPVSNPLLMVLREVQQDLTGGENWVWAISNAERILRWNPASPNDARLSYNLAALLDSALPHTPDAARASLLQRRDDLHQAALDLRDQLQAGERAELVVGLLRLDLLRAARQSRQPDALLLDAATLTSAQQRTADQLLAALARRIHPEQLASTFTQAGRTDASHTQVGVELGERATDWLAALRWDTASTLGQIGLDRREELDSAQLLTYAQTGYALLDGQTAPPALAELRGLVDDWRRWLLPDSVRLAWQILATVLALAVFLLLWRELHWIAVLLRRRKALLTSFYRLEADAQRRAAGRG